MRAKNKRRAVSAAPPRSPTDAPPATVRRTLRDTATTTPEAAQPTPNPLETLPPDVILPADAARTLHDLRVHQIELQVQNEELRRIQIELENSRARYFELYDLAPVGYCTVSESGLILEANLTAATLLGMARGECLRQPISRFIHPEDQDNDYLLRKKLIQSRQPDSRELRMVRSDGTPFWAYLQGTTAEDATGTLVLRLVLSDVTARKLTEEALHKAGALQRAIFNSANFSSIATDAKGIIQIFNVGAERMLGYTAAEVINKMTPTYLSDPQEVIARASALSLEFDVPIAPGFEAMAFKSARDIEDIYELTHVRKDGSQSRPCATAIIPLSGI